MNKKGVWNQTLNTFNQKLKNIQFQKNLWSKFLCKWPKSWCLPIYSCVCVYQIDVYWNENEKNGLNNERQFRVKCCISNLNWVN